ncbi:MAG: hypothetical protein QF437_07990, partial [Planctomycetota bacterium]|nr:hypothetical protein [Planctomycetota bacterium]
MIHASHSLIAIGFLIALPLRAEVGIVSHINILSDGVKDISSLQAWRRSFIREDMSDKEKALAIWETVVRYQHQDSPPREFLQHGDLVHDPIKLANVYGYSFCSVASASVQALSRELGIETRGWTIKGHVVPELKWDGAWHLLDSSLINYFPKEDGKLASVEEIVAEVKEWFAKNPGFKGSDAKLRQLMRKDNWRGWRIGPSLLNDCPFYSDSGWLPAATHGWYSTMQEYDGSTLFDFEAGYSLGYQVNVQLRTGERLTRNWSNKGLHVNMDSSGTPGCLKGQTGKGTLRYTPRYGDIAPGRIGNGTVEYDVPLASGGFRFGALQAENLSWSGGVGQRPAVHVKDASKPAILILRMPSSYVYLGGDVRLKATAGTDGSVEVFISDNNGLDWNSIALTRASGLLYLDLKPFVFRRYDYRLKVVMKGKGTRIDSLKIRHDIQHSQRPLPALHKGSNTITVAAGLREGTITIEGNTNLKNKNRQLVFTDFHPKSEGLSPNSIQLAAGQGSITFPIETPGEMKRLRIHVFYRVRDARDAWEVQVSFDAGKSFKAIERLSG